MGVLQDNPLRPPAFLALPRPVASGLVWLSPQCGAGGVLLTNGSSVLETWRLGRGLTVIRPTQQKKRAILSERCGAKEKEESEQRVTGAQISFQCGDLISLGKRLQCENLFKSLISQASSKVFSLPASDSSS